MGAELLACKYWTSVFWPEQFQTVTNDVLLEVNTDYLTDVCAESVYLKDPLLLYCAD